MMMISEKVEKALQKEAEKCVPKLESPEFEFIRMAPVLQSGGNFDLKWTAQTEEKNVLHLPVKGVPAIHVATITACCATTSRPLMFNAKKDQRQAYNHLFEVFDEAVK
jgi:nucleosome binding factor SPN SPT16 subunit